MTHFVKAASTREAEVSCHFLCRASGELGLTAEMFPGCQIGLPTDVRHVAGSGGGRLTSDNV